MLFVIGHSFQQNILVLLLIVVLLFINTLLQTISPYFDLMVFNLIISIDINKILNMFIIFYHHQTVLIVLTNLSDLYFLYFANLLEIDEMFFYLQFIQFQWNILYYYSSIQHDFVDHPAISHYIVS